MENDIFPRMKKLIKTLNAATEAYDCGKPIMSDSEWDKLYFDLLTLEKESGVIYPNSPTSSIHFEVKSVLAKAIHNHPMLSLQKTKNVDEVKKFIDNNETIAMAKLDGLTCSLTFEKGVCIKAETRGNGEIGEDILHNILVNPTVPAEIPYKEHLVVDGEIICTYNDFETFKGDYSNPRNFAAGSIRLLDAKESFARKLTFIVWDVITPFTTIENTLVAQLKYAEKCGFKVVPMFKTEKENVRQALDEIEHISLVKNYPIDGVVFKYNDLDLRERLGWTAHHFNNAIAYKFADDLYDTVLRGIKWTMGRTGSLTPVAMFEPIEIDGAIIENANLHNINTMIDLLGPELPYRGQRINIYRANMIIPQIAKSSIANHNIDKSLTCAIPKKCPICGQATQIKENEGVQQLMCVNPACEGLLVNRLNHYLGKKGLDAKGISTAILNQLIDWGWVTSFLDLYSLEKYASAWVKKDGFGIKSVEKILNAIKESSQTTFAQFLCALGIPLIGMTASTELATYFKSYEAFRAAIENGFHFFDLPNFGLEKHGSIITFDYKEADELVQRYISFKEFPTEQQTKILNNITVVITGKLVEYKNRTELQKEIEKRGGKVTSSISSKTTYLINNDFASTSTKNQEAKRLNIPILTEKEFIEKFLNS